MSSIPIPTLSITVVNLQTRTDRRREATEELVKLGLVDADFQFFAAKAAPHSGAMGCALSHAMALSRWLFDTENEYCLMLEDDFTVRAPDLFWQVMRQAIQYQHGWDVFMLACNQAVPLEGTPIANVYRVANAQTTSAYVVRRRYVPTLIEAFFQSAELFRIYGAVPTLTNYAMQTYLFAIDMIWKKHQISDRYWACLPQVCIQRPSYSDVEKRITNYGV